MGDSIPGSWHYDLRPKADAEPLTHAGAAGWGALNLMEAVALPLAPSGQALNSQTWGSPASGCPNGSSCTPEAPQGDSAPGASLPMSAVTACLPPAAFTCFLQTGFSPALCTF